MRVFLILKEADILHGKESVPRPTELFSEREPPTMRLQRGLKRVEEC